ncbi:MAG: hypothetical protein WCO54_10910 [Bacteroidota bacterium]
MKKIITYSSVFIILVFMFSCSSNKDDGSSIDLGYNYFPVEAGHVWIYDVDSFGYDNNTDSTVIDTTYYQYKEATSESMIDDIGKPAIKVERYFRKHDSDTWQSANTWIMSRDNLRAQKVQDNIRYVKLVFPLNASKTWDGNMFNNIGQAYYDILYFDQPSFVNGKMFDKTVMVREDSITNFIDEIKRYSLYARNVGLISFTSDSLNTQSRSKGPGTKSKGFRYRIRLRSFQ